MILKEEKRNLFTVDDKYYFAHCISSDCKMGAGIAVDFQNKFYLRNALLNFDEDIRKHPTCILIDRVFNLITKKTYSGKPTYKSLEIALEEMGNLIDLYQIKYLAMPKIGCGLDRLQWGKVREIIKEVFQDTDIEILICYL
jgi:hypothetical protein